MTNTQAMNPQLPRPLAGKILVILDIVISLIAVIAVYYNVNEYLDLLDGAQYYTGLYVSPNIVYFLITWVLLIAIAIFGIMLAWGTWTGRRFAPKSNMIFMVLLLLAYLSYLYSVSMYVVPTQDISFYIWTSLLVLGIICSLLCLRSPYYRQSVPVNFSEQ